MRERREIKRERDIYRERKDGGFVASLFILYIFLMHFREIKEEVGRKHESHKIINM